MADVADGGGPTERSNASGSRHLPVTEAVAQVNPIVGGASVGRGGVATWVYGQWGLFNDYRIRYYAAKASGRTKGTINPMR
jgi:hypothetical protein